VLQKADIESLVQAELSRMDSAVAAAVQPFLVAPRLEQREWDYGAEGQTYPCWIVLEHQPSNTGISYCAQGFGPKDPWGLLFLRGPHLSMGMDSGWFSSLEDAFRGSMACDLPTPPGYEVG
jgi:hypothetical protein